MKTVTEKPEQHVEIPLLTLEKLKQYPKLASLTDAEAENIAESLLLFSQLTFALFQQQLKE